MENFLFDPLRLVSFLDAPFFPSRPRFLSTIAKLVKLYPVGSFRPSVGSSHAKNKCCQKRNSQSVTIRTCHFLRIRKTSCPLDHKRKLRVPLDGVVKTVLNISIICTRKSAVILQMVVTFWLEYLHGLETQALCYGHRVKLHARCLKALLQKRLINR